ncbi:MAG: TetR family transcriptional regulator [Alphaproteobacteria bacterium]|nr:TetR family transcriptional regulator [Alphaproteobacteria bacterium]
MARRTKEEAEQTRKDILQAALNMFCEKGYTATTLDEIAKSIHLTKGAVYWYFRNKPDILKALIIEDFEATRAQLESFMPAPQTLEDLKRHFMFLAEKVDTDVTFRKFLYFLLLQMEWSVGLMNSFHDIIEELNRRLTETIQHALENAQKCGKIAADLDVTATTYTIHAMWSGLLFQKLQHQESSLQETANYSFDFIINALTCRKD